MAGNLVAHDCSYNPYGLYISPCTNPCEYPGHPNKTEYTTTIGVVRLLNTVYAPFDEAPTLLGVGKSSYTHIERKSVTFKARMSGRGRVFCLAKTMLNEGTTIDFPVSVEEIRYAGFGTRATTAARAVSQSIVQEWGEVQGGNRGFGFATTSPNMKIFGLAPATNYSIHCMSESLDGLQSNDTVLSDERYYFTFRTACCKTVELSLLATAVKLDTSTSSINAHYQDLLQVDVDYMPTKEVTVTLLSTFFPNEPVILPSQQVMTQYEENSVWSPRIMTFTGEEYLTVNDFVSGHPPLEYPQTRTIDFLGGDITGVNTVVASITGLSAEEYEVVYNFGEDNGKRYGNATISIIDADSPLPGPKPIDVIVSDDGVYVSIVFDMSTDKGGFGTYVQCKEVLQVRNSRYLEFQTDAPTMAPTGGTSALPLRAAYWFTDMCSNWATDNDSKWTTDRKSTMVPSSQPTSNPTSPTSHPSRPLDHGSHFPTGTPTSNPSLYTPEPSPLPSSIPSSQPSGQPTGEPTSQPSGQPTTTPSMAPNTDTASPSYVPSGQPTADPSSMPSASPTLYQPPDFLRQPGVLSMG